MDNEKEIPFGAFDSELMHQEIFIPEGFEATIDGDKIILTRIDEDEKIVNAIRKALESKIEDLGNGVTRTACLTWLVKQGEKPQRMISAEAKEALYDKHAWSEEDEEMFRSIKATCELAEQERDSSPARHLLEMQLNWLKSLKGRYTWKPSEELDEASYQVGIKRVLNNPESYGLTKYNWNPSDEQMEALNDVISSRDIKYDVLSELWKDLNTLKRGEV